MNISLDSSSSEFVTIRLRSRDLLTLELLFIAPFILMSVDGENENEIGRMMESINILRGLDG